MKRKLQLNRETLRNLAGTDLSGAQGQVGGLVSGNPQSCVYVCQIPTIVVSCNGTCLITRCIDHCEPAGTITC